MLVKDLRKKLDDVEIPDNAEVMLLDEEGKTFTFSECDFTLVWRVLRNLS